MTRWGASTDLARSRAIVSGIVAALVACAFASLVARGAFGAPAPPTLSINDVSQTEGNSGNKSFVFTVTLSSPSDKTVKVDYQAVNGSATVGSDFNPSQGSLSFDPGQTTGTITVTVRGDTTYEPDETFFVNLSNPRSATIADGQGQGTIVNDDQPSPALSINDVTVVEGTGPTPTPATFTVKLTSPAPSDVTFDIATQDGSGGAVGGPDCSPTTSSDYISRSVTGATIPAGQQTYSFTVQVCADSTAEPDETFLVNVTNPSGAIAIADGQGVGTITNDDGSGSSDLPSLSISDPALPEGNSGTTQFPFTVTLSKPSQQQVKVNYATANGTATALTDYQPTNGQLLFKKGETTKTIIVLVNGDTVGEPDETFLVNLSGAQNAVIAQGQGVGTIQNDDDAAPSVSSTVPADGDQHLGVNTNITVNFSEPVTFTTGSFTLECPSGTGRTFTVSGSGTATATLDPTSDLPEGTVCAVKVVANQISDVDTSDPPDHMAADYAFSFTTDAAPAVTTTAPADGATNVDPTTNVTVNFSEPVNVDTSSFTISCNSNPRTFSVSGSGTSAITVDPSSDLPAASNCTVTAVAANISDVDTGDPPDHPAANYSFSFTTQDVAPSVTTTSPADAADHVAVNTNITVNFSEPVTFTTSSFALECPSGTARSFTVSGSGTSTATLDPTSDLPEGTLCAVKVVASQISDVDTVDPPDHMAADFTFSFTTDAPPAVTTTAPADGATNVDPTTNVTVNFSEPVDVTTSSFTISCDGSPQTFSVSGSGTSTVTVDPTSSLPSTASCTVTAVAANISDSDAGDPPDHPAADYRFSFTTQDAAPSVSSTTPADGATDVARSATVAVTFSESVSATNNAFSIECPTGTAESFSQTASPATTFTLTPSAALPGGTICTITVHKDEISDTDTVDPPDHMAADYVFSFTTKANSAPTDIQLSSSSIAENQPSGTDVGTLTTTDPDAGDTHTYTLASSGCGGGPFPDNNSFQIGGAGSDTLQSAAAFDFETKSSYTVCVRSTDGGSLSFDKQFTISVTNVNEPPTDIALSSNSIDENRASGSLIGTLSQSGDPDSGETYTFALLTSGCSGSFPDSNSFQVSGSQLQSAVSFNYEVKSSYTICVRVADPGSPNLSFDKQFTISINDVNDPPVAHADSYSGAIGNTLAVVQTTGSGPQVALTGNVLTANDTDEDTGAFAHALSAVTETATSTGGGTATVNTDGSFTFLPGVGDKNQDDTFTYHVTDGTAVTAGTVTVHIDNVLVWYVNNVSAAVTHDGRSNAPFLDLSSLNGAGGSGDSDGTGDTIFLYQGVGSYGGGIPLEANQSLWGEPNGLTVDGHTLVAAGGTAPVITNASGTGVGLANGADVQGVNISGTSGDGINGVAVTTATVGTSTAVNISSAGADGVDLSGAAGGNISIAAPITGSAGHSITVSGRSSGTTAFSGAVTDGGTGISLSGNTGATISLTGGVTASTGANSAFSATGGGTVNVTGANNTLATTTGTALKVDNTTIGASGLTFKSITAGTGSGSSGNGIFLSNTGSAGGLTVAGGTTAGSGGTIQHKTGADGATDGVGIYLNNTSSVSLARMQLNDFDNFAIRGAGVAGFSLANSTINGANGTSTAADEASVAFTNLTGSASITNDTISGGVEDDVRVQNTTGSLSSLSVTGSTFATTTAATANDALAILGKAGATVVNASVQNNSFTRAQGDLFQYTLETGTGTLTFSSNTVTNNFPTTLPAGGGDINISSGSLGNSPSLTYTLSNNQIYASGTGGQPPNGSVIVAAATPQGSATGTISGNTIGTTGVTQSGGFDSILVDAVKAGFHKVTITNNTIRRYGEAGIRLLGVSPAPSPGFTMRATVKGNLITEPDSVAFAGIDAEVGADPADIGTMCLDLGGTVASDMNSVSTGDPNNFNDINLVQQFATSMNLPGYVGAADNNTLVEAFVAGRNSGNGAPTVFASHDTTTADGNPAGSGFTGTGTDCA